MEWWYEEHQLQSWKLPGYERGKEKKWNNLKGSANARLDCNEDILNNYLGRLCLLLLLLLSALLLSSSLPYDCNPNGLLRNLVLYLFHIPVVSLMELIFFIICRAVNKS